VSAISYKTHTLLQSTDHVNGVAIDKIDEVRFNNECEMNVNGGLHGSIEDENWWAHLMTWRR
jgi:hypothetical protein